PTLCRVEREGAPQRRGRSRAQAPPRSAGDEYTGSAQCARVAAQAAPPTRRQEKRRIMKPYAIPVTALARGAAAALVTAAALVAGLALAADAAPTATASSPLLEHPVRTASGLITGIPGTVEGVAAFKGIPFAEPPVGTRRWKPAERVAAWHGIRTADKFGAVCLQPHQPQRVPNNR